MRIAIPKEKGFAETRVAASPETVKKFKSLGFSVLVETDAGKAAQFTNEDYKKAGADVVESNQEAVENADLILHVRSPLLSEVTSGEIEHYKKGAYLIGLLDPYTETKQFKEYASKDINCFSLELIPRISRAQTMDVLSSQSNLAGYKAVIDAAAEFGRAFPMMMTAAGTIPPARVLVLGAGVAGLQAIATAKRLGAIVSAFDVRPSAKEQVESLGGTFIQIEMTDETSESKTGYAQEMSEEYQKRQMAKILEVIQTVDIVICTALIPGKPAPLLVTKEMVHAMKSGSVIVDLAVERGGNCALSKPGKVFETSNIKILGYLNVPGRLAGDASRLYARNLFHFVELLVDKESKALKINLEDEIISSTLITHNGEMVHPQFQQIPDSKKQPKSSSEISGLGRNKDESSQNNNLDDNPTDDDFKEGRRHG